MPRKKTKPGDMPNEMWYTTKGAARYLGLSIESIHVLVRQDRLHPEKVSPRKWRFRKTELWVMQIVREVYATFPNKGQGKGWYRGKPRKLKIVKRD